MIIVRRVCEATERACLELFNTVVLSVSNLVGSVYLIWAAIAPLVNS